MFKKLILIGVCVLFLSGCGWFEGMYDDANYESLTNEKGTIEFISGGKIMYQYKNAKIKYSSADTDAIWFKTADGQEKYIQPGVIIHLN